MLMFYRYHGSQPHESKCDKIAADIKNVKVKTAQVNADNVDELVALFNDFKPELVVNLALPYQEPLHHGCLPGLRCQLSRHCQLRTAGRGKI